MTKKERQLEFLERLKKFILDNNFYFNVPNAFETVNEIIEQISNTETLRMSYHIPLIWQMTTSEKQKLTKDEFAKRFSSFLVDNDYVKVKSKGVEESTQAEIYETILTFVKEESNNGKKEEM